ncbi:MAG: accessory gene regulator B family protein [Clostridiaceae bacterium]
MAYNSRSKISLTEMIAEAITTKLNKQLKKDGLELQKMKLGIEIILINFSKFIVILSLAIYFNYLKEVMIMMLCFGSLRRVSFGIHARSSMVCTIISVVQFILGSYFSHYIKINNYIVFIVFSVMNLLLYKYAPSDTENHPLIGKELRDKLKKESVFTGILLMGITLVIQSKEIQILMVFGAIFQVMNILPLTYKVLNRGYNNYEKYER